MNTEELKTFIFLSKVKNFTLAAEQMFIAQSTVTNRISELEKEVGKRLFSRGSKTVTLTEEGKTHHRASGNLRGGNECRVRLLAQVCSGRYQRHL